MLTEVNGLVVRTINLSENDSLLSVYTAENGMMTALAKGVKSVKSRVMYAVQLFCYSRFILYRRGDKYWIREAELIESFYDIRLDLQKTALAGYVCDVLTDVAVADPDVPLLRLTLNTLFAVSEGKYPLSHIKAAFELRCAAIIGLMPDLSGCCDCGKQEGEFVLDIMDGVLTCPKCREAAGTLSLSYPDHEEIRRKIEIVTPPVRAAMLYVMTTPLEKLLSFRVYGEDKSLFERVSESYLINHLERSFRSLSFYHEVEE